MSCTLYLVRHGIAGDAPPGMSDADRELTAAGQRKLARAARGLKRLGVAPDCIVSSPLKRAEQTASLLAAALAPGHEVEMEEVLAPGHAAADVVRGLGRYRGARAVLLVGHEPNMGELASQLLAGSASLASVPFRKGAVAAFRVSSLPPRADAQLLWFLTAKLLRLIGR